MLEWSPYIKQWSALNEMQHNDVIKKRVFNFNSFVEYKKLRRYKYNETSQVNIMTRISLSLSVVAFLCIIQRFIGWCTLQHKYQFFFFILFYWQVTSLISFEMKGVELRWSMCVSLEWFIVLKLFSFDFFFCC